MIFLKYILPTLNTGEQVSCYKRQDATEWAGLAVGGRLG